MGTGAGRGDAREGREGAAIQLTGRGAGTAGALRAPHALNAALPAGLNASPPPHACPADYGFDPLNLGKNEEQLNWYVQAELQNGRWAMLGTAGILVQVGGGRGGGRAGGGACLAASEAG